MAGNRFIDFSKLIIQKVNKLKEWFLRRKLTKMTKRGNIYKNWGLGIECPFYLSAKFSIDKQPITINGFQKTPNHSWPVRYSIVKTSKLGASVKYLDSVVIYGNYLENELQHTFQIPVGSDYQLEIFNYYSYHSAGKVRINPTDK